MRPVEKASFAEQLAEDAGSAVRRADLPHDHRRPVPQQIKRGAHRSVAELEAAITAYIKIRNAAPKPFRWTKSADAILASIERFCRRTLDTHAKCA